MRRRLALLLLAGAAMGGTACARGNQTTPVRPADAPVTLHVTNNNPLPVEIMISGSGSSFRLGTVHPGMSAKFTIPPTFVGGQSVEFNASNSAGGHYQSGSFQLQAGEIIDMTIATQMFSSVATLRN